MGSTLEGTPCGTQRARLLSYGGQAVSTSVARPNDLEELRACIEAATRAGKRVTFHGGGRSFDTQALNRTLVISLKGLDRIAEPDVWNRTITVGPGATWGAILEQTLAVGMVPFVMVTSRATTAGGTASADCLSRFSPSCGKEGAHVRSLRLVQLDGQVLNCSRSEHRDVFYAVISGFGYLGAIAEVTYELLALDYTPGEIAVETDIVPFVGTAELAERLVGEALRCHGALCQEESELHVCAAQAIAATRQHPRRAYGLSAALYMNAKRQGLLMRSNYTARTPAERNPTFLHQPNSFIHLLLQVLALFSWTRRLGWWISLNFVFSKPRTYTDEIFGYTFFQDGNERIKQAGRALGLPMGVRQQTYIIPWDPDAPEASAEVLAAFLDRLDRHLDERGLLPAIIDVLYLPDDGDDEFLLSSSHEMSGFAVSLAFERVFTSDFADVEKALREISRYCAEAGGRVHLVKHVFVDPELLTTMYPKLDEWIAIKERLDPERTLQNEFLGRTFPDAVGDTLP
ncbi:MAG: FAD-binding oxidoreductase [Myxococcales bacterium]|nr:FAD-binding oxidoreductase [Myxococcales bacterium]MDD9969580.1 FAD-binding oxidoreductase [Myxococcales bacterium]